MRRRAGGSLAVLSVVLFLVACTELAPRVEGVRGPAAPLWTSFEVSGRIAVRSEDDAFSGNFAWRHSPDADSIDLLSPLGQTAARLSRDAAGIRFQSGDGHSLQAPDWEALTQRALGWSLPVAGLSYWMQGVPAPNTGHKSNNDEANRLQELHQDGWTIR